jgi:hypothetical protein
MCVLECIYISVYLEQYNALKDNSRNIITQLKKFYKELFNKPFPEKFDGLDIMKTLEHASSKYNIKFIIYNHDENERLQHLNTICSNSISSNISNNNIHNLLMINGVSTDSNSESVVMYVMYVKDIQKYTKLQICPKCGYTPPGTDHRSYNKERFEEHIQNCEDKIKDHFISTNNLFLLFLIYSRILYLLIYLLMIVKMNTE